MGILETLQKVVVLAKSGMTIELQEQVMELREAVLELTESNLTLRSENLSLRTKVDELSRGARCPKCLEAAWKLESSRPHPTFGRLGSLERTYKCSKCGFAEAVLIKPGE